MFPIALGLSLLPLLVSAVVLWSMSAVRTSRPRDYAYTELLTRDVGHHPVLTGLYSRTDWNHPGPTLFYLLALPYRLTGSASIGIHVSARSDQRRGDRGIARSRAVAVARVCCS